MRSDIDIADSTPLRPITEIAAAAGISADALEPYGRTKAKIRFDFIADQAARPDGALVLVTGISPTPAGEGKTTTTIGLGDALRRIGQAAVICLREPSLGPCFGIKGGATGGGMAQVAPMAEINLHFTGDFHAITAANNLLAAMLDNHVYWGNALGIDPRRGDVAAGDGHERPRIAQHRHRPVRRDAGRQWRDARGPFRHHRRVRDHGGCFAWRGTSLIFRPGWAGSSSPPAATARRSPRGDLKADGAMAALLRDALMPNLVQSLEGTPALVHGGPFANIAHGCNSVVATRLALKLAPVVVTEAGFGADLGGEKFLDIKCRAAGLSPAACVIVATIRALKMHGGVARADLAQEDLGALQRGMANLVRHVENMRRFGLPVVVALNRFASDTAAEFAAVQTAMADQRCRGDHLRPLGERGRQGAEALAHAVMRLTAGGEARFAPIYPDAMGLADKIRLVATRIYRARDVEMAPAIAKRLAGFEAAGYGHLPVCIAKTPYSFSADPTLLGAPEDHVLPVREVRLSAGAGFVVAVCGDVMTMPGLPRRPSAEEIGLDPTGRITGLF